MATQKKNKYGNKKVEYEGKKFDSKLELYMYRLLQSYGIEFEFQVTIELIPKIPGFKMPWGQAMRRTTLRVDFVVVDDDRVLYIDTKGYSTETSKLKYKLLADKKTREGADFDIIWLKDKKAALAYVNKLKFKKDE